MNIFGVEAYPIWKDIEITTAGTALSALESVDYSVYLLTYDEQTETLSQGDMIASGRAQKRPGDTYVTVRVNDIISGYLPRQLDTSLVSGNVSILRDIASAFRVVFANGQTTAQKDFSAFADWSYDYAEDFNEPNTPLAEWPAASRNAPIIGNWNDMYSDSDLEFFSKSAIADVRQYLLFSFIKGFYLYNQGLIFYARTSSGYQTTLGSNQIKRPNTIVVRAAALPDCYNPNYPGNVLPTDLAKKQYKAQVEAAGTSWVQVLYYYRIRETCAKYCLYYQNALGGWDWFLILGKAVESDQITRTDFTRRAPSALWMDKLQRRGKVVNSETLVRHLELHTQWLTDAQAARMHHLTESPDVYVHDLEADIVYPAVLTNTQHVVKSYKNEGHRLVSYQIDLDYAVERQRR